MASLADDPKGWELEDFVAAHFVSRGCYVETGVTERGPDALLELDVVWTDYRQANPSSHPVEVKSGGWGLGDVFKFYGWTRYLDLEPGQFIYKEPCGRLSAGSLTRIGDRTGIDLLHVSQSEDAEAHLAALGLPGPSFEELAEIWRYSFWLQRRLLKSLGEAIGRGVCVETAKAAKEYHQLINDAVFFDPNVQDRIRHLLSAHFDHQGLAKSAAYEIESGIAEFESPPQTDTFHRAYFYGEHFPVQACLYLAHRARLYILKAVVDYWLARERGEIRGISLRLGDSTIDLPPDGLTLAMTSAIDELSSAASFRLFPVFWQVFLWSWGGFLLTDDLSNEYERLSQETGVPMDEISLALSAFDKVFPTDGGWFRQPTGDGRRLVMLMPAVMRGLGAFRRMTTRGLEDYKTFDCNEATRYRLESDHSAGARILDCDTAQLVT